MWATVAAIAGAIKAFFGFGEKIVAEVHDANQRKAGANQVTAENLKESKDASERALEAAVNTSDKSVDDSLREGRF